MSVEDTRMNLGCMEVGYAKCAADIGWSLTKVTPFDEKSCISATQV